MKCDKCSKSSPFLGVSGQEKMSGDLTRRHHIEINGSRHSGDLTRYIIVGDSAKARREFSPATLLPSMVGTFVSEDVIPDATGVPQGNKSDPPAGGKSNKPEEKRPGPSDPEVDVIRLAIPPHSVAAIGIAGKPRRDPTKDRCEYWRTMVVTVNLCCEAEDSRGRKLNGPVYDVPRHVKNSLGNGGKPWTSSRSRVYVDVKDPKSIDTITANKTSYSANGFVYDVDSPTLLAGNPGDYRPDSVSGTSRLVPGLDKEFLDKMLNQQAIVDSILSQLGGGIPLSKGKIKIVGALIVMDFNFYMYCGPGQTMWMKWRAIERVGDVTCIPNGSLPSPLKNTSGEKPRLDINGRTVETIEIQSDPPAPVFLPSAADQVALDQFQNKDYGGATIK